ncbi:dinucleotide-utilizing enzyme [Microbacterium sp. B35-04]|uniref:dinucleotide-utilizing enzyme n=1 Tax=unclassified Microbacterium TaxID=2609290 RepID=UPI0013D4812C|nr:MULTISPECIES: dinucleotide-utilizing enzyme [unclassified Microbacterium]KAF2413750.1 dinucleotide-utilizing enzyme [Microbacterium sp. B35-04]KAF2416606.1 dinucleotide-utilizing enzyme [Microbacterium sp. B35-30]
MSTRPPLIRSIPFWGLVVVSLATVAGGWFITTDKIASMTSTLTDGTATGVDVYVGQSMAQLGGILIGAGIVGILLSLGIAALSTLRPHAPVEVVEPIDWDAEADTTAGVTTDAAPQSAKPAAADAEPAVAAEPAAEVDAPVASR